MRVAIVTDSNSGITQNEARELKISVLPMPFFIDGREHFEDIDLSQDEFYQKLEEGADISTSQPSPESVTQLWDELLTEYDEIVHIPMSSGLSSACQTALMLAQDYDGRVQVVNNHRVSVTQRQSAFDAMELAKRGWSAFQIKEELERIKDESTIYITVDTLKYLKKGGRITPAAAALGTLLRIKPVLVILGEKLDAFAKARTLKQAKGLMMSAIQRDLEMRLNDPKCQNTHLQIAHTQNDEAAKQLKEELHEIYPETDIYIAPLSLSVSCHIGPGALAIACTKKLEI